MTIAEEDLEDLLVMEPRAKFDPAMLGVVERYNERYVLYSKSAVIRALTEEGMDEQDALEHYDFNIRGGWVGERTPGFLDD